jgi:hypothetical protein
MPKFFFDVSDGTNQYVDREGVVCPDVRHAEHFAQGIAEDLRADGYEGFSVNIRNEQGEQILQVSVAVLH